jgi:hypothetical protein
MRDAETLVFIVIGWIAAMCFAAPGAYQALITLGLI